MSDDFKPWNVKEFPVRLRARITDAAAKQHVTVAEWLTAYFEQHDFGDGEALVIPRKENPANPEALDRAIDRACKLSLHAAGMPKGLAALAFGLVKDELRALKGPALPRSPRARLPGITFQPAPTEDRSESENRLEIDRLRKALEAQTDELARLFSDWYAEHGVATTDGAEAFPIAHSSYIAWLDRP